MTRDTENDLRKRKNEEFEYMEMSVTYLGIWLEHLVVLIIWMYSKMVKVLREIIIDFKTKTRCTILAASFRVCAVYRVRN
jgi:hypothetical protein